MKKNVDSIWKCLSFCFFVVVKFKTFSRLCGNFYKIPGFSLVLKIFSNSRPSGNPVLIMVCSYPGWILVTWRTFVAWIFNQLPMVQHRRLTKIHTAYTIIVIKMFSSILNYNCFAPNVWPISSVVQLIKVDLIYLS